MLTVNADQCGCLMTETSKTAMLTPRRWLTVTHPTEQIPLGSESLLNPTVRNQPDDCD